MHSKLPDIGTTIFAVMSKMAADYDAINLSQGFPDFPIAEEIIALVHEGMKKGMKNQSSLQKSEMGAYGCNRCASHYECIVFDDIRGAPFDKHRA